MASDSATKSVEFQMENDSRSVNGLSRKRTRLSPKRFGVAGSLDLSDSFEDPYADNSLEDSSFIPSEDDELKKVAAEATSAPSSKRAKLDGRKTEAKKQSTVFTYKPTVPLFKSTTNRLNTGSMIIDLNDEFDQLASATSTETDSTSKRQLDDIVNMDSTNNKSSPPAQCVVSNKAVDKYSLNDAIKLCQHILEELRHHAKETSARLFVMEKKIMSNEGQSRKSNAVAKIEENRIFAVTNRLPLQNLNDLKQFEEGLKNNEFMKIAVRSN